MGKKTEHHLYENINTHCFHIIFDFDENGNVCQSEDEWCEEIFTQIPYFAFGDKKAREKFDAEENVVKNSMKLLYNIKEIQEANTDYLENPKQPDDGKYLNRGEFGELILYYLLKKKLNRPQLISKIYFKDTYNAVVHGFDAVHYDKITNELWIGESKLYTSKYHALRELEGDLTSHFNQNFFGQEFTIISDRFKDLGVDNSELESLIDPNSKFLSKLVSMNACFFALFNDPILDSFSYEPASDNISQAFLEKLKKSVQKTRENFDQNTNNFPYKNSLKIHLFLFPVQNKQSLVKKLHEKLKKEQI